MGCRCEKQLQQGLPCPQTHTTNATCHICTHLFPIEPHPRGARKGGGLLQGGGVGVIKIHPPPTGFPVGGKKALISEAPSCLRFVAEALFF